MIQYVTDDLALPKKAIDDIAVSRNDEDSFGRRTNRQLLQALECAIEILLYLENLLLRILSQHQVGLPMQRPCNLQLLQP